ncbi:MULTISPECIES: O-antigen ligase family protein [unclassified Variovorax]|uniref:O-antigen ligase family protein n=1 Tax=unclassified Variovorax TaxID=663243 RepID=UPI0034E9451C
MVGLTEFRAKQSSFPEWILYFVIGCIVLNTVHFIPPDYKIGWKLIAYSALMALLFFRANGFFSLKKDNRYGWFLIYGAFYWISLVASVDSSQGLSSVVNETIVAFALMHLIVLHIDKKGVDGIIFSCFVYCSILVLASVLISIGLINVNYYDYGSNELGVDSVELGALRFSGVYSNPNGLGILFSVYAALLCHYYKRARSLRAKSIYISLLIFSGIGVAATLSRAAIVAFSVVIFIYFFLFQSWRGKVYFVGFALLPLALFFLFLSSDYLSAGLAREEVFNNRDVIWRDALGVFEDNFFLGLGPGMYSYDDGHASFSAHNYYINSLANTGILVTAAFLFFLISVWRKSYSLLKSEKKEADYSFLFSFAFISSLMIHQFAESGGFAVFGLQGVIFFICCGNVIAASMRARIRRRKERPTSISINGYSR